MAKEGSDSEHKGSRSASSALWTPKPLCIEFTLYLANPPLVASALKRGLKPCLHNGQRGLQGHHTLTEGDDIGIGVAWHSEDSFVIVGYTKSADFPICEAYQDTYAGSGDMFIMKLDLDGLLSIPGNGAGFTFGLVEISIIIGVIVVIVVMVLVRRRTG